MEDLRISILQAPLQWERKKENLHYFEKKIASLASTTDAIVLPEMFSTGFSMNSALLAEKMDGPTLDWMRNLAAHTHCVIAGSLIIEDNKKFYNRFVWMPPNGKESYYNKRHLFRMAGENQHYKEGSEKTIVEYMGWKFCLQICYDLRFPVWSRRTIQDDYDVLLYVANWPERRGHAWKSLLIARAIENQSYVVGVNRIGIDGNNIPYLGESTVIDYSGESLTQPNPNKEICDTIVLKKQELVTFRKSFPAELDADSFSINMT
jgi:predicted amidohydrolase